MKSKMKKMVKKVVPKSLIDKKHELDRTKKINIYDIKVNKVSAKNLKKVSVIVPNYNYERFLKLRLDSLINQSYPIYELILLDDNSSDNSTKLMDKYVKDIKNIKIKKIYNNKNSGSVFSQWQKGFKEATGEYVWIAEADDFSHPDFLKNVMKAFDDDKVVLSYSESMRVDENNYVIQNSCRDWMPFDISDSYWNKNYIHDGLYEISNAVSMLNTIPNVSAVVFRNDDKIIDIIEEAKGKYKISGDWYLYYKLLLNGKIGYCAKSLNYFRKHSFSTSTVAKKDLELTELLDIQATIRNNVQLDAYHINRQRFRYEGLLNEVSRDTINNVKNKMVKRIAWIMPFPIKGSGGIRTMVNNANFLVKNGYSVDVFVEEDYRTTDEKLKKKMIEYYGECLFVPHVGIDIDTPFDLMFATYSIKTADYVNSSNAIKKAYFIQDFEPWFEPMGQLYLEMERSYKYGLDGISIGRWLNRKIETEFKANMNYFDFCADLNVYKPIDNMEKENAVCFIFQPDKSRRCSTLGINALKLVKTLRPDVKIYLYGCDIDVNNLGLDVDNLKIITQKECNELYNKCSVGLCISSSNPSRIPFEMMAAGLPVVDLYRENNLYDMPSGGVLLADSTPEGIATAIIKILDDVKLQNKMSMFGKKYMKDYPIEKGYNQFLEFVKAELDDQKLKKKKVDLLYKESMVEPSDEVMSVSYIVQPKPIARKNTGKKVRFLVGLKGFIKYRYKTFIARLFRI